MAAENQRANCLLRRYNSTTEEQQEQRQQILQELFGKIGHKTGDNITIGAGSVVVKDIPDNVVAAGNPCRVIRYLS